MFFAYIILGSLAGATGAIYILLSDATFVAVVGTFVAVSRPFFGAAYRWRCYIGALGKEFLVCLMMRTLFPSPQIF